MENNIVPQPARESIVKHKREKRNQIILPIILVTVAVLAIAVFTGISAANSQPGVGLWADISLIWLIAPMLLAALIILALMIGLIYGANRLLKATPHYTGKAQAYILWLSAEIMIWTDNIVQPLISIRTWMGLVTKNKELTNDKQK